MKKTATFGLLAILLAFSFVFASCLGGDGDGGGGGNSSDIPQEWRTTYRGSTNRSVILGANILVFENMLWPGTVLYGDGALTGMSVEGGGTITQGVGGQVGGKYVYLLRDGQRFGLIIYIEGLGRAIGLGNRTGDGADDIINTVLSSGGVFNPPATALGMPTNFAWGGNTWN